MGTSLCFLSFFPHLVAHLLTCQILVIIINGVLVLSPHLWDGFVALQQFDGWTQMTKRTQTSCKSFFLSAALVLLLAQKGYQTWRSEVQQLTTACTPPG
jgi:hypothetical protein